MSDDEDDWFEQGLSEDGDSEQSQRGADADESDSADAPSQAESASDLPDAETADGDGSGTGASDSPFGDTGTSDSPFGETGTAGDSPFDEERAGAGSDSPFGDAGGGDGGAGGGAGGFDQQSDEGGLFEDDFADAMGEMGGDAGADFESEDFETDIPRLDVGIEGLDNMIQGGIPERHLIVTIGGAGTGKTTFGLQYIHHGLQLDDTDKGVFITLEQTYDDIMATANERGWEFDRHEEEGNLAIVDLDPVEMANSLDNIRGELPELIKDFDADRFVLDSVSLLEMMYDDVSKRRTEIFDFTQSLKDAGVTTVFTSEANENNPYASRHGIIEYLTDAVFLLRYVRSETQETRLAVEIQKIRNANHSRETKPYEITMDGISVYEQANIF